MRPQYLTPSEEFYLNGFVCEETVRHLLDHQITFDFVQTIQEELDGIFKCLPEDNTEWWVKEIEERMPPSEDRWKLRSQTYNGVARAMADQWGDQQCMKDVA